ncbi:MAG: HAMP domain-containing protein [Steroidobacteraceae bacterium]
MAGIRFDWLPQMLADAGAPRDAEAMIIAGTGGTVARFRGADAVTPHGATLIMGDADLDGPAHAQDRIHVGLPIARAQQAGESFLRKGFAALGGVFALLLLFAWLGSTFFVARPLRRLTEAAARLDAGDLAARTGVPHHAHEIGRLARQLDQLAAHRQKVTRALSARDRVLLREQREHELLQAMCRVAVDKGAIRWPSCSMPPTTRKRA